MDKCSYYFYYVHASVGCGAYLGKLDLVPNVQALTALQRKGYMRRLVKSEMQDNPKMLGVLEQGHHTQYGQEKAHFFSPQRKDG